jgi:hypothetical protein
VRDAARLRENRREDVGAAARRQAAAIVDFRATMLDCDECGGKFRIERVNEEPVPISEMPRKLLAMTRSRLVGR